MTAPQAVMAQNHRPKRAGLPEGFEARSFEACAAHDYRTLMGALIERKQRLGLTDLDVDFLGALPSGYASKLFTGRRVLGLISLGKLLTALNVRLVVAPLERGLASLPEKVIEIRLLDGRGKDIRRSEWGKRGHVKRMCLTTAAERRRNAKRAGEASAKARAAKKLKAPKVGLRLAAPAALTKLKAPPLLLTAP